MAVTHTHTHFSPTINNGSYSQQTNVLQRHFKLESGGDTHAPSIVSQQESWMAGSHNTAMGSQEICGALKHNDQTWQTLL